MNHLEDHVERCILCEPEIGGCIPLLCQQGRYLRSFVRRRFMMDGDGHVHSTDDRYGPATIVEFRFTTGPCETCCNRYIVNMLAAAYTQGARDTSRLVGE